MNLKSISTLDLYRSDVMILLSRYTTKLKMASSSIAAMESVDTDLRITAWTTQEYYLQGSILDSDKEQLVQQLQGLCDYGRPAETFRDHEIVYCMPR